MKKVLILVNHDVVIYNFRKELVERLLKDGYKVYIASPYGEKIDLLVSMGCEYLETNIERHGTNIITDLKLILEYRNMIKTVNPDVVLSYTIKPNIYGGLACQSLRVPYIATVTGLGTAVERKGFLQKVLLLLYRFALKNVRVLFFQNKENRHFFEENKIANETHKLVPGSGVNLNEFKLEDYPEEKRIIILFVGRIMKEKGIEELVKAAETINDKNKQIEFEAIGFCESDYKDKANQLEKSDIINFHGVKDNVHEYIKNCHAVILPSYHEGMANVLLEAASTGRPVLASNIPGCKETFDEGISGFGFQVKDSNSLIEVLQKFRDLPYDQKKGMGTAGRMKMEKAFDRQLVVDAYISEINKVLEKK